MAATIGIFAAFIFVLVVGFCAGYAVGYSNAKRDSVDAIRRVLALKMIEPQPKGGARMTIGTITIEPTPGGNFTIWIENKTDGSRAGAMLSPDAMRELHDDIVRVMTGHIQGVTFHLDKHGNEL